jgi:hypothetical protein
MSTHVICWLAGSGQVRVELGFFNQMRVQPAYDRTVAHEFLRLGGRKASFQRTSSYDRDL